MTATHANQIIDGYLKRLDGELSTLPPGRRKELTSQIAEHIAQARSELTDETDADLLTILDHLGEPDEIAAEAHSRLDITPAKPGPLEILALLLIGVGGVLFPVLPAGWVLGTGLVWRSKSWSHREKYFGAYLPLVVALVILLVSALGSGVFGDHVLLAAFFFGIVIANVLMPLGTAIYLGIRLGRRLPILAWTAIAVIGVSVYLPAIATVIPPRESGFIGVPAGETVSLPVAGELGCGGFYGTVRYGSGTPLVATAPVSVGVCWNGTRVRKTWGPDCFPTSGPGVQVTIQDCQVEAVGDGSLIVSIQSTATAMTAPFFRGTADFGWRITPDGKVMGL